MEIVPFDTSKFLPAQRERFEVAWEKASAVEKICVLLDTPLMREKLSEKLETQNALQREDILQVALFAAITHRLEEHKPVIYTHQLDSKKWNPEFTQKAYDILKDLPQNECEEALTTPVSDAGSILHWMPDNLIKDSIDLIPNKHVTQILGCPDSNRYPIPLLGCIKSQEVRLDLLHKVPSGQEISALLNKNVTASEIDEGTTANYLKDAEILFSLNQMENEEDRVELLCQKITHACMTKTVFLNLEKSSSRVEALGMLKNPENIKKIMDASGGIFCIPTDEKMKVLRQFKQAGLEWEGFLEPFIEESPGIIWWDKRVWPEALSMLESSKKVANILTSHGWMNELQTPPIHHLDEEMIPEVFALMKGDLKSIIKTLKCADWEQDDLSLWDKISDKTREKIAPLLPKHIPYMKFKTFMGKKNSALKPILSRPVYDDSSITVRSGRDPF